jgi:transcriptional regulator with XRE-family HTH domain
MNFTQLKAARTDRGWSQQEAAARLGVSQGYLSLLESGRRSGAPLARKLMDVYDLSPTVLPVSEALVDVSADSLAHDLASLGYPGFAHLSSKGRRTNPAEYLLKALGQHNLEARVAEGLPWLVLKYPDMPFEWLVREARASNLQNRLGFAVTLGRRAANSENLVQLESTLADSKLAKEDTFCRELKDGERHWLREHSSDEAKQWHLLSDLQPSSLRYVTAA